jgi:hypothetical protein
MLFVETSKRMWIYMILELTLVELMYLMEITMYTRGKMSQLSWFNPDNHMLIK